MNYFPLHYVVLSIINNLYAIVTWNYLCRKDSFIDILLYKVILNIACIYVHFMSLFYIISAIVITFSILWNINSSFFFSVFDSFVFIFTFIEYWIWFLLLAAIISKCGFIGYIMEGNSLILICLGLKNTRWYNIPSELMTMTCQLNSLPIQSAL